MAPMLERWNAIYLSTINKSDKLTGDSCVPRLFRVNHQDAQDAAVVRPWLATREDAKWAILAADIAWGRDSGRSFFEAAKANQRVAELYSPFGSNDYASFIQQIKTSGAKGLWVALTPSISPPKPAVRPARQPVRRRGELRHRQQRQGARRYCQGRLGHRQLQLDARHAGEQGVSRSLEAALQWRRAGQFRGRDLHWHAGNLPGASLRSMSPKAMGGGTFDTILGKLTIRVEDHQIVAPNYFGYIGEWDGKLRPIITMAIPAEQATPASISEPRMCRARRFGGGLGPELHRRCHAVRSHSAASPVRRDACPGPLARRSHRRLPRSLPRRNTG
jgi:branched-chain amino acid transport system substrate-binding protein